MIEGKRGQYSAVPGFPEVLRHFWGGRYPTYPSCDGGKAKFEFVSLPCFAFYRGLAQSRIWYAPRTLSPQPLLLYSEDVTYHWVIRAQTTLG